MDLIKFTELVERKARPVVLVEGTRSLPEEIKPKMKAVARMMAGKFPHLVFRTGNAPGADKTFTAGVADVDPHRLEVVLPYAGHRKKEVHPRARSFALEQISEKEKIKLCDLTVSATPSVRGLLDLYRKNPERNRNTAKAFYLVRDTLKVVGSTSLNLAPATLGLFHVNLGMRVAQILHEFKAIICKALWVAAVVCYRKALITQQMEASGTPVR